MNNLEKILTLRKALTNQIQNKVTLKAELRKEIIVREFEYQEPATIERVTPSGVRLTEGVNEENFALFEELPMEMLAEILDNLR